MTEQHDALVDETSPSAPEETAVTAVAPGPDATQATPPTEAGEDGSTAPAVTPDAASYADDSDTEASEDSEDVASVDGDVSHVSARRRPAKTADLEREGEVAADFLETLLDIADLDGDIEVDVDGDRAAVSIVDSEEGRVPRRLVGPDGKVLEALQELTRLAVQSATGERSRLMLDVAGHRAERRAALVTIAQEAIAGVKSSGEKASLEPMTAFERKVVHDEVLAAGLVSESDGVEPRRFVVVLPS
ncbi:R3H domain-containing nucleic acid-binding protein [Pedococcus sp. KACC 23699]|uniref:R3H domain-containing nucleic acid-binding protein n=1 Tax=Pedococcus sp. KACC 23699 TaxID=3149228 RepID=A0AAU7JYE5_9MICO